MSERGVWVMRGGELIPAHLAPPLHRKFADGPMVIRDCMDATRNHADGKLYDSKRAYERAVRASGCEIVGNEKMKLRRREMSDPVESIKAALEKIESRTPVRKKKRRKHGT